MQRYRIGPVWPYDLIGDTSALFPLARRTYAQRPFIGSGDWSLDPIQAARLDWEIEMGGNIGQGDRKSQHTVNVWQLDKEYGEFYIEQCWRGRSCHFRKLWCKTTRIDSNCAGNSTGWDFEGSVSVEGRPESMSDKE